MRQPWGPEDGRAYDAAIAQINLKDGNRSLGLTRLGSLILPLVTHRAQALRPAPPQLGFERQAAFPGTGHNETAAACGQGAGGAAAAAGPVRSEARLQALGPAQVVAAVTDGLAKVEEVNNAWGFWLLGQGGRFWGHHSG